MKFTVKMRPQNFLTYALFVINNNSTKISHKYEEILPRQASCPVGQEQVESSVELRVNVLYMLAVSQHCK
jgi:hypothetical protein